MGVETFSNNHISVTSGLVSVGGGVGLSPLDGVSTALTTAASGESGLTKWARSDAGAWALLCPATSPVANGTEVDQALVLVAVEHVAWAN